MKSFIHAYGGREHDEETDDPKCLLCRNEDLRESLENALAEITKLRETLGTNAQDCWAGEGRS